ncbi:hypothetical protein Tco_1393349, partial [Tanacetum coccineum]
MGRDTIQLEDAVSTISQEYLLEFSSEYFIPENLHPELPGPGNHIVDFPEGKISGGSNAPAKVLRKDYDAARAEHSARGGKSLADMSVDTEFAIHVQETQEPHVAT